MYGYQIIQSTLHYLFLLRFYVNFCATVVKCKGKKVERVGNIGENCIEYICLFPKDTLYVSSSKYILPNAFIFSLTGCPSKSGLDLSNKQLTLLHLHLTFFDLHFNPVHLHLTSLHLHFNQRHLHFMQLHLTFMFIVRCRNFVKITSPNLTYTRPHFIYTSPNLISTSCNFT